VDYVAKPALSSGKVRLDSEVVQIIQQGSGSGTHAGVMVEMADGLQGIFDEVIVTTPLGWLKRNKAAFQPCLPTRLVSAIDGIGFGNLEKVYVTFPKAF
jgi:monoamine oxidase